MGISFTVCEDTLLHGIVEWNFSRGYRDVYRRHGGTRQLSSSFIKVPSVPISRHVKQYMNISKIN